MLWWALIACGPSGPKSEDAARADILKRLEDRYGEAFEAPVVRHVARGLDGMKADRHEFEAHPVTTPEHVFAGLVDYDPEPMVWEDDYPCRRDAEASQAALDDMAGQTGAYIRETESRCIRERLTTIDPKKKGAAFGWKVRLATFGDGDLEALTTPMHAQVAQAATAAGIEVIATQIDLYDRGQDTVMHFPDKPIPPSTAMWYVGTTVKTAIDGPVEVGRKPVRATGVEADLAPLVTRALPPNTQHGLRVFGAGRLESRVKKNPELALADIPADAVLDLKGYVVLAVVGTPEARTDELRRWMEAFFKSLPDGRFAPSVYVTFFDPSIDDRPLSTQPDKQLETWLFNGSVGLRIKASGIRNVVPIKAFRYAVPVE